MIWQVLGLIIVAMIVLCSPPVVRRLSRPTLSPIPVRTPDGMALTTAEAPVPVPLFLPVGVEKSGRLVALRVISPSEAVFALRHAWVSADLGFPVAYPLVGTAQASRGAVTATVVVSRPAAAASAAVVALALLLLLALLSACVREPSLWTTSVAILFAGVLTNHGRHMRRGLRALASDAVAVVQGLGEEHGSPDSRAPTWTSS